MWCMKFDLFYSKYLLSITLSLCPAATNSKARLWETDNMETRSFSKNIHIYFNVRIEGLSLRNVIFSVTENTAVSTAFRISAMCVCPPRLPDLPQELKMKLSLTLPSGPTSLSVLSVVWRGDVIMQLIIPQVRHGLILNDKLSPGSLELNPGIFCPSFPSLACSFACCVTTWLYTLQWFP